MSCQEVLKKAQVCNYDDMTSLKPLIPSNLSDSIHFSNFQFRFPIKSIPGFPFLRNSSVDDFYLASKTSLDTYTWGPFHPRLDVHLCNFTSWRARAPINFYQTSSTLLDCSLVTFLVLSLLRCWPSSNTDVTWRENDTPSMVYKGHLYKGHCQNLFISRDRVFSYQANKGQKTIWQVGA